MYANTTREHQNSYPLSYSLAPKRKSIEPSISRVPPLLAATASSPLRLSFFLSSPPLPLRLSFFLSSKPLPPRQPSPSSSPRRHSHLAAPLLLPTSPRLSFFLNSLRKSNANQWRDSLSHALSGLDFDALLVS
ncbi:hypothetical protein ACOSQ3_016242 [Xanthoceras sorbifolium]